MSVLCRFRGGAEGPSEHDGCGEPGSSDCGEGSESAEGLTKLVFSDMTVRLLSGTWSYVEERKQKRVVRLKEMGGERMRVRRDK